MSIEISGIRDVVKRYKELTEIKKISLDFLVNETEKKLQLEYLNMSEGMTSPIIYNKKTTDYSAKVYAQGEGLTFEEYGTGTLGLRSNYPSEKLPISKVPKTEKWIYNYPSRYKRFSSTTGTIYWFAKMQNGKYEPTIGRSAGMQVYKTSKFIKQNKTSFIKTAMKKHFRSVASD